MIDRAAWFDNNFVGCKNHPNRKANRHDYIRTRVRKCSQCRNKKTLPIPTIPLGMKREQCFRCKKFDFVPAQFTFKVLCRTCRAPGPVSPPVLSTPKPVPAKLILLAPKKSVSSVKSRRCSQCPRNLRLSDTSDTCHLCLVAMKKD